MAMHNAKNTGVVSVDDRIDDLEKTLAKLARDVKSELGNMSKFVKGKNSGAISSNSMDPMLQKGMMKMLYDNGYVKDKKRDQKKLVKENKHLHKRLETFEHDTSVLVGNLNNQLAQLGYANLALQAESSRLLKKAKKKAKKAKRRAEEVAFAASEDGYRRGSLDNEISHMRLNLAKEEAQSKGFWSEYGGLCLAGAAGLAGATLLCGYLDGESI